MKRKYFRMSHRKKHARCREYLCGECFHGKVHRDRRELERVSQMLADSQSTPRLPNL